MSETPKKFDLEDSKVIDIHLAEYDALRRELEFALHTQQSLTNYSIAITAASASLFALGQPPLSEQMPFLLLIASVLLSSVNLAIIDMGYSMQDIGTYTQKELTPKIRGIVGHEENDFEYEVLNWETVRANVTPRLAFRALTSLGKYAVGYIPSLLMIVLYSYLRQQASFQWIWYEKVLFGLAILLVVIVPISGALNTLHLATRNRKA